MFLNFVSSSFDKRQKAVLQSTNKTRQDLYQEYVQRGLHVCKHVVTMIKNSATRQYDYDVIMSDAVDVQQHPVPVFFIR